MEKDLKIEMYNTHAYPEKVKATILQHPSVKEAIVALRQRKNNEKYIISYVVLQTSDPETRASFEHYVAENLAFCMTPETIIFLEELPLTPEGKVDQRELLNLQLLSQVRTGFNSRIPQGGSNVSKINDLIRYVEERGQKPATQEVTLPHLSREQLLPTSFAQQRLWFTVQLDPTNPFYNMYEVLRLTGTLQCEALTASLQEIIRRQESLRTRFVVRDGVPWQEILPSCFLELVELDLSSSLTDQQEQLLHKHLQELIHTPFELSQAPLLRAHLIRLQPQQHVLVFCLHHIISDGWSRGVFLRELTTLYRAFVQGAPSPLAPLACHYADFAQWQRQDLQGERLDGLLAYWRQHLHAAPPLLSLPIDTPRPLQQRYRGALSPFTLSSELSEQVRQLAHRSNATLFQLSLTAFALLLQRYSGQDDLVIGTALAGRTRQEVEDLIGFFVNTLPLRICITGNETGRQLLEQVRETVLAASAHQDLPFEKLVESLQPERSLSYHPIFQVACIEQNIPHEEVQIFDLRIKPVEEPYQTSKFDLTLFVGEEEGRMMGAIEYDTDLFEASTIQRLLEHWQVLLHALSATPDSPCWSFPLLSESEVRLQFACPPAQEALPFSPTSSVLAAFAAQVRSHPEALAVVTPTEALSYQQLDAQANQLAQVLRGVGIGFEDRVGVCLPRSSQLLVCLLAILKAGGVYIPLDPAYPAQRIQAIVQDAQPGVILCSPPQIAYLTVPATTTLLEIDALLQHARTLSPEESTLILHPGQLAYIIYTSGSTGSPKGIAITHGSVAALLDWSRTIYSSEDLAGVLASTSICFDLSVFEIFIPLCTGGKIILVENVLHIANLSSDQRVTLINTVPSAIIELLRTQSVPDSVRVINLAGEPLPSTLVRQVYAQTAVQRVFNLYGPSEDTVYSTWALMEKEQQWSSIIGISITATQVYLLDRHLQPVPPGVPGEIYIGGSGLARGYIGCPGLTATSFIPHPFSSKIGERLYKTGDMARMRSDRVLEFLGRIDKQVKVRGFRIELGEIEHVLNQHTAIQESLVLVCESATGDKKLAAYIVPQQEQAMQALSVQAYLEQKLPGYMVPASIVFLEKFPLTSNGKIDRKALPGPGELQTLPAVAIMQPGTLMEKALAAIWQEVLNLPEIGITQNFFAIGGHSLLATQIVSRMRQTFNVDFPIRTFFEIPTIEKLAQYIEGQDQKPATQEVSLPHLSREQLLPTSFAQQRLWFTIQLNPTNPFYNMYEVLRLTGTLQREALTASLQEIIRRQESLRTRFVVRDGVPWQEILPSCSLELVELDLSSSPADQQEQLLHKHLQELIHTPFELSQAPLLRAHLIRLQPQQHVLVLCLHHIISDGWSRGVLMRELTTLYRAFVQGATFSLAPLACHYADFAQWQRQDLQGERLDGLLAYWRQHLHAAPPLLSLPTDTPRPPQQRYRGTLHFFTLPSELSEQVRQVARSSNTTLFMVLLSVFALLLQRYSGQDDLVIGTDVAGRTRQEVENLIGFFVNTLPLRIRITDNETGRQLLEHVREMLLAAYAHQDLPFEKLVESLQPERSLSYHPLFQVKLVMQNIPQHSFSLPELSIQPVDVENITARFDLLLNINDASPALYGHLEYNTDLFTSATAVYLLEMFEYLLHQFATGLDQKVEAYSKALSDFEQRRRERKARQIHEVSQQKMQVIKRKRVI